MPVEPPRPTHLAIAELATVRYGVELGPGGLYVLPDLVANHCAPRGIRHSLGLQLACTIDTVTAGGNSFSPLSRWIHQEGPARLSAWKPRPEGPWRIRTLLR